MVFTETILSIPVNFVIVKRCSKLFENFYFSRTAYYNFDLKRKITKKIISHIFKKNTVMTSYDQIYILMSFLRQVTRKLSGLGSPLFEIGARKYMSPFEIMTRNLRYGHAYHNPNKIIVI